MPVPVAMALGSIVAPVGLGGWGGGSPHEKESRQPGCCCRKAMAHLWPLAHPAVTSPKLDAGLINGAPPVSRSHS